MTQRFTVLSLTPTAPFDDADGVYVIIRSTARPEHSMLFGSAYVRHTESIADLCMQARAGDVHAIDERLSKQLSLVRDLPETDFTIACGGHYETHNNTIRFSTGKHQQLPGAHAKELAAFFPAVREYSMKHWVQSIELFWYAAPVHFGYSPKDAKAIQLPISIKR